MEGHSLRVAFLIYHGEAIFLTHFHLFHFELARFNWIWKLSYSFIFMSLN